MVMLILASSLSTVMAIDMDARMEERLRRLARRGEIMIDRSPPPLMPRQVFDSSTSTAAATSSTTDSSTPSAPTAAATSDVATAEITASSTSSGSVPSGIAVAPSSTSASGPLPSPFDTSLGNNFTAPSCPSFFQNFLNNATFKMCNPVSLLLQNSNSFFHASRSPVTLSQTLDNSCGASMQTCAGVMSDFANAIVQDSNCGQDYRNENPQVLQAHAGLVAYEPLYRASCLKNAASGNYSMVDAFTNSTNPSDSYPYYLAIGLNFPGGSTLTCDSCLQNTMGIFASFASNKTQPLSATYVTAAQQIDQICGPTFVNSSIAVTMQTGNGVSLQNPSSMAVWTALLVMGLSALSSLGAL